MLTFVSVCLSRTVIKALTTLVGRLSLSVLSWENGPERELKVLRHESRNKGMKHS